MPGAGREEGIARAVVTFIAQILAEDHENVPDVLRQLEAVGVGQALDAHPAPAGAHPVRLTIAYCAPGTAVMRTTHAPPPTVHRTACTTGWATAPHQRRAAPRRAHSTNPPCPQPDRRPKMLRQDNSGC